MPNQTLASLIPGINELQPDAGAAVSKEQGAAFRVWAPRAKSIEVVIIEERKEIRHMMKPDGEGYYSLSLPQLKDHADYFYLIDAEKKRPDPRSCWQPFGVHGPSRLHNPYSHKWKDHSWKGIPLTDYTIYELHIGTFTPEGTFDAAIAKIPYLKSLGITAVELMPVVEFPGQRNWGYDGVFPFAPHHRYGGPDALKQLIDACHQAELAVVIDAVYNHLGPEGNYLGDFGYYFTEHYKTPWGQAVNFDGPESDPVRRYFIDNALYWITEYHADAIRLDAVHAIYDFSARHILDELREEFHRQAERLGRKAYIIAESDLNDVRIINPYEKGGYALDAQWNDDWHHAIFSLPTQNRWGYFADFGSISDLAKAITEGFVYQGQYSNYRKRRFGNSSYNQPGSKFVICIENHDQIGNATQGKRLGTLVSDDQYRLMSILLFSSPNIPLLFMGQEWKAQTPFYFFTSFEDQELAKNVTEGYIKEFRLEGEHSACLDPQNPKRFIESKLDWQEPTAGNHKRTLELYQTLLRLRKSFPCLNNCRKDLVKVVFSEEERWIAVHRGDEGASQAMIICNLSSDRFTIRIPFPAGKWKLALDSSAPENPDREAEIPVQSSEECSLTLPRWSARIYMAEG